MVSKLMLEVKKYFSVEGIIGKKLKIGKDLSRQNVKNTSSKYYANNRKTMFCVFV